MEAGRFPYHDHEQESKLIGGAPKENREGVIPKNFGRGVFSPGKPTLVPLILLDILTTKDIKDKNMIFDRIFYSHRDTF